MISFDRRGRRFKHRAAGLCIHDGYVLLTKADQNDYRILPGGRVELLEDTRTTLHRESTEETGHEAEIRDLPRIVESFFHLDETNYHELAFIYAITPTDPAILNSTWPTKPRTETPTSNSGGLRWTTSNAPASNRHP